MPRESRIAARESRPPARIEPDTGLVHFVTEDALHTRVMVVEDDRDTREVVKLILEMEGIAVIEAYDGLDALDQLHSLRSHDPHLPCVVVLDMMMPRCSGPEFRKRQLGDPLISDVPVIILSAVADQPRVDELDAFAKVAKPFDPDQLIRVVRSACHIHGA